ncbi:glycosyltransferase [Patescibacteria group bacterium]|nr:glycosyltransferase [Patescibacteria group bacterium]
MTKVDVVIVNWNTGSLLAKCLASLSHLPERTLIGRVIVVDNNSSDDSIGQAEALASPLAITFFKLKENIGFARGNNVGIRKLTGQHHLLLLNPDTEVQPGALRELVEALGELSQAGIVGAKLLNSDRTDQSSVQIF